jgi:hypothetical protein
MLPICRNDAINDRYQDLVLGSVDQTWSINNGQIEFYIKVGSVEPTKAIGHLVLRRKLFS